MNINALFSNHDFCSGLFLAAHCRMYAVLWHIIDTALCKLATQRSITSLLVRCILYRNRSLAADCEASGQRAGISFQISWNTEGSTDSTEWRSQAWHSTLWQMTSVASCCHLQLSSTNCHRLTPPTCHCLHDWPALCNFSLPVGLSHNFCSN